MKIDRRGFLSFVAGGAVGTALSPLPWKLMDDISIWSQVWPWVPVPKNGESVYAKSICYLCSRNCGINIRKIEDRAIKIDGLTGHPINDGKICGLGLSGLQFLYGPTRVKYPMKRIGDRGEGRWQKIEWEEAISIVVEKLISIENEGGCRDVACISGLAKGSVYELIKMFFKVYGSPNFLQMPTGREILNSVFKKLCNTKTESEFSVNFDLENSEYILSFGSGLFEGWLSPVRMMNLKNKWDDNKVKLVQIEPRLSTTAVKANQWVSINPGMESELAFGISALMIEKGNYDRDFILRNFPDFDKWKKDFLSKYSLKMVSKITGVQSDIIVNLADSFANTTSSLALGGRGKGDLPNSSRDYASILLLNFLKGNLNKSGGIWVNEEFKYIDWSLNSVEDLNRANINLETNKNTSRSNGASVSKLISNLVLGHKDLKALFIVETNPCYVLSDTLSVEKAFEKIPFIVSFSSFMDETVAKSDLVLPSHFYLERLEDREILNDFGKPMIGLCQPVVSHQLNTRHIGDLIIDIAGGIGKKVVKYFPWSNYKDCLQSTLGDKWESMISEGVWIGNKLESIQINGFNLYDIEIPSVQIEGNIEAFPLILIPYDSIKLSSNYIYTPPFLMKTISDTVLKSKTSFVDINPQTAEFLGFKDGDYSILQTPKGEVRVRIHLCDGVRPGIVTMVRGLGHTAYDNYIASKGVNINSLVGPVEDPIFDHDAVWGIRAKLAKA